MTTTVRAQVISYHLSDTLSPDARALFERVIGNFEPKDAWPLWERWARYEYQYGNLEAAQKLEKRIAEVYPAGKCDPNTLFSYF
jgi:hypothetical protein